MARQPIRDGWRVLRRAPEAVLGEIAWRWTFGVTMCVLLIVSFHTYLSSIEISRAEYATLKAFEPFTWIAITVRVLNAIAAGVRTIGPVLFSSLALLWIAIASVGRVFTVRALSVDEGRPNWPATITVHGLRVLSLSGAILAYFGAGILVAKTFNTAAAVNGTAFVCMFLVLVLLATIWAIINWFLSSAAIFTAKDGSGVIRALQSAADLYVKGNGGVSVWFALIRTAALILISFLSLFLVGAMLSGHWRGPLVGSVFLSLIYFAVADFLYIWRLAAYIGLTEPEPPVPEEPTPPLSLAPEQLVPGNPQSEGIPERDEVPRLASEEQLKADS